jgi:hypothetical protein
LNISAAKRGSNTCCTAIWIPPPVTRGDVIT